MGNCRTNDEELDNLLCGSGKIPDINILVQRDKRLQQSEGTIRSIFQETEKDIESLLRPHGTLRDESLDNIFVYVGDRHIGHAYYDGWHPILFDNPSRTAHLDPSKGTIFKRNLKRSPHAALTVDMIRKLDDLVHWRPPSQVKGFNKHG